MSEATFNAETAKISGHKTINKIEGLPSCVDVESVKVPFECDFTTENAMEVMKWLGDEVEAKQLEAMENEDKEEAA